MCRSQCPSRLLSASRGRIVFHSTHAHRRLLNIALPETLTSAHAFKLKDCWASSYGLRGPSPGTEQFQCKKNKYKYTYIITDNSPHLFVSRKVSQQHITSCHSCTRRTQNEMKPPLTINLAVVIVLSLSESQPSKMSAYYSGT